MKPPTLNMPDQHALSVNEAYEVGQDAVTNVGGRAAPTGVADLAEPNPHPTPTRGVDGGCRTPVAW